MPIAAEHLVDCVDLRVFVAYGLPLACRSSLIGVASQAIPFYVRKGCAASRRTLSRRMMQLVGISHTKSPKDLATRHPRTEILNERKYFCTVGSKSSYRTARDRNRGSLRPMPIALLKYALKSAFKGEHAGDAHFKWTPDLKPHLRRHHHRRRRPWPRGSLLSRDQARHHQYRGA